MIVVGDSRQVESEGFDRTTMDLPIGQDQLIAAVAAANPRTVVIVLAGSPVTMTKWIGRVPAVLCGWFGGQEAGHAVGDTLWGRANPSGKLPVTWPKQLEDSPRLRPLSGRQAARRLRRGHLCPGYRGFDRGGATPLFPLWPRPIVHDF